MCLSRSRRVHLFFRNLVSGLFRPWVWKRSLRVSMEQNTPFGLEPRPFYARAYWQKSSFNLSSMVHVHCILVRSLFWSSNTFARSLKTKICKTFVDGSCVEYIRDNSICLLWENLIIHLVNMRPAIPKGSFHGTTSTRRYPVEFVCRWQIGNQGMSVSGQEG